MRVWCSILKNYRQLHNQGSYIFSQATVSLYLMAKKYVFYNKERNIVNVKKTHDYIR